MNSRSHILIVAHQADVAEQWSSWVEAAGHGVSQATSFSAAKAHLATASVTAGVSVAGQAPAADLVVAEVKLGDYNGLHLALRARSAGIRAVVIGHPDLALEREAETLGAGYLPAMPSRTELLDAIRQQLSDHERAAVSASGPGAPGNGVEALEQPQVARSH